MGERWLPEYVIALAPDPASAAAARRLASPAHWVDTGCDARALWGRYLGTGAEPYEVAVELEAAACRCSCLSRKVPCKHALGLLLLWSADGVVEDVARPPSVARWMHRRNTRPTPSSALPTAGQAARPTDAVSVAGDATGVAGDAIGVAGDATDDFAAGPPSGALPDAASLSEDVSPDDATADDVTDVPDDVAEEETEVPDAAGEPAGTPTSERDPDLSRRAAERAARVAAGLSELDRWLSDCVRTGLADAGLDRTAPWETVATRLVDAQAGSLANRVRRLAERVTRAPDHHDLVLSELGLLHLLARGGCRAARLPGSLADAVRAAVGWTVRQEEVRSYPPVTDRWLVAGRSDVQEDRIVVRRTWLQGADSGRWAMVLSFAAYGQALDAGLPVGTTMEADLHYYPSARPLRALLGMVHDGPRLPGAEPPRSPTPTNLAMARAAMTTRATKRPATSAPATLATTTLATTTLAGACDEVGAALAAEPWLERWPVAVHAAPTVDGGRWVLADGSGGLAIAPEIVGASGLMALVALSAGVPLGLAAEWTPAGIVPLAVHLDDRVVEVGPHGPWGYG